MTYYFLRVSRQIFDTYHIGDRYRFHDVLGKLDDITRGMFLILEAPEDPEAFEVTIIL